MTIRIRLTLLFTLVTAAILAVFLLIIVLSARSSREREFYDVLRREAITKANLFFEAKVPVTTLQDIYRNNRATLNEVEVAIYAFPDQLLYHDAVEIDFVKETPEMLAQVFETGNVRFYQEEWQVIGLLYQFEGRQYVITAAALDAYGYRKMDNLLANSLLSFLLFVGLIFLAGYRFSARALQPVKDMTEKARQISALSLDLRLSPGANQDELAELAATFNQMLDRLEQSFDAQKQFVSHMAHEVRTPLAAMTAELEMALTRERSVQEYRDAIGNALADARRAGKLITTLLDLARASYDPTEISFAALRVDEVLLDACQQVTRANAAYTVDIHFQTEFEQEEQVMVSGNEYLLKVAFANLMENGCKFSADKRCQVFVAFEDKKILLRFEDRGIGLDPGEAGLLFSPFFRGKNAAHLEGNGIGLFLTHKIVRLHGGTLSASSQSGEKTVFLLEFPNMAG